ncbi:hypothetical protein Hamer_G005724 [Homarus americanus]|uniref:Uncharacterized protein n=1 Tax=Homarus americanus TaxID=6706 RepID=A0A8J5JQF5_HOMAM|nr:hypothetical protein Hamer_G005724 [Homarus americanus]
MVLLAADGAHRGYRKIFTRAVDTNVVVLYIVFNTKIGCECLWVGFGTGWSCYLYVTRMAEVLGEESCSALPAFHALTSSFAEKVRTKVIPLHVQPSSASLTLLDTTADGLVALRPTFKVL